MMFRGRCFSFSAPNQDLLPEPEQMSDPRGHLELRSDPAILVSGESDLKALRKNPDTLNEPDKRKAPVQENER